MPLKCWSLWLLLSTKSYALFKRITRWNYLIEPNTTFCYEKKKILSFIVVWSYFLICLRCVEKRRQYQNLFLTWNFFKVARTKKIFLNDRDLQIIVHQRVFFFSLNIISHVFIILLKKCELCLKQIRSSWRKRFFLNIQKINVSFKMYTFLFQSECLNFNLDTSVHFW